MIIKLNDISDIHLLGDIHGEYHKHDLCAKKHQFTIQLGDFGFKYDSLNKHDHNFHKVLGGNHDNYNIIGNYPHYLGDYGAIEFNGIKVFYLRGAYSIDRNFRVIGLDWWPEEEIRYDTMIEAIGFYIDYKPDVIISHSPPAFAVPWFVKPTSFSKTELALQEMHGYHSPKLHFFGHMHQQKSKIYNGTKFICVAVNQIVSLMNFLK